MRSILDCLFPEVYDDLAELLRRGVRIYLLKRTRLIKGFRDGLGLRKNVENDAKLSQRFRGRLSRN